MKMLFSKGRRFSVVLPLEEASEQSIAGQMFSAASPVHPTGAGESEGNRDTRFESHRVKKRKKGKSFRPAVSSLQVFYLLEEGAAMPSSEEGLVPCRVMVHAPKRVFRHAVDRNRVKRLLREAYRAHKGAFARLVPSGKILLIFLQFTGNRSVTLPQMNAYVEQAIKTLSSRLHHA